MRRTAGLCYNPGIQGVGRKGRNCRGHGSDTEGSVFKVYLHGLFAGEVAAVRGGAGGIKERIVHRAGRRKRYDET